MYFYFVRQYHNFYSHFKIVRVCNMYAFNIQTFLLASQNSLRGVSGFMQGGGVLTAPSCERLLCGSNYPLLCTPSSLLIQTSSSTLMVPWLLAATMTLLFCFQQTADTNSFTSSSFLSLSRNDLTASNLNENKFFDNPL